MGALPLGAAGNGWGGPLNGVNYQRSEIKLASITDGVSNTIYCGERYLGPDWYQTGLDIADNESMYQGFENDTDRSTYSPPMRDTKGYSDSLCFGSPLRRLPFRHVRRLRPPDQLRRRSANLSNLGSRNDGQAIDPTKL